MDIHVIRFKGFSWVNYPKHQRSFSSLLERNLFFIRYGESLIPISYGRDMLAIDDVEQFWEGGK